MIYAGALNNLGVNSHAKLSTEIPKERLEKATNYYEESIKTYQNLSAEDEAVKQIAQQQPDKVQSIHLFPNTNTSACSLSVFGL